VASENLELVRSIYAGREGGDYSSSEWAHPEIEYVIADGPLRGSWKGVSGMAEGWRDFLSAWEHVRPEVDEYRELDGGRVLVLVRLSGRGKASGLELQQLRANAAAVYHIEAGKVTKLVHYWDRERALADLGLTSEADSGA
jgi:ketosteroid isomerase-like protein